MKLHQLRLSKHPKRQSKRYLIIQDFLNLSQQGKIKCLNKMIEMTSDLYLYGLDSRYVKHLFSSVFELKSRTVDGGARVYFIATENQEFVLTRAECKKQDTASIDLLNDTADILVALEQSLAILNPIKGEI